MNTLFSPLQLGALHLQNRIVMAPMTRNRADPDGCANALMARYYGQRGDAGLVVAEGTWPSAQGQAYCRQPGIAHEAHVQAWKPACAAVHARGGLIALQIMHGGRIGSVHIKAAGSPSVAPSAVRAHGEVFTDSSGMQAFDLPEALSTAQVQAVIAEHGAAAGRARAAGFDAVELHCTSGYLPMQFLCSGTNLRTDAYGGNALARSRFALECLQSMGAAIGIDRVGLRISPGNTFNDTSDENSTATHFTLLRLAAPLGLAYVHVMRSPSPEIDAFGMAAQVLPERLILNDGFGPDTCMPALAQYPGAALSFARHFVGNPDLVRRLRQGLPLARFDRKTLYTPGAAGYTDYPVA
jgi:NADPH2 dehydrogenase/N-ethylmaleimide reductase